RGAEQADVELSEELFGAILSTLRKLQTTTTQQHDRRAWPRVPMQQCMAIIPYHAGKPGAPVTVWVRDISCGGVGIIHSEHMAVDERFLLELPAGEARVISVICAVAYAERLSDGLFTIGARFKRILE